MSSCKQKGSYKQAETLEEYLLPRSTINLKTQCWEWNNSLDKYGYSNTLYTKFAKLYNKTRAHQLAYICWKGEIPKGICVLHKCDNRKCINPLHLFLGTQEDNRLDMLHKNRQKAPFGESHVAAKLTKKKVQYILANKGVKTSPELAKELDVSFSLICQVWRGERWKK